MSKEKFKCLICGTFFYKTKEEWNKYNTELAKVDDPDKITNKIMCPNETCKSTKLQHLIAVPKNYIDQIVLKPAFKIWDYITDVLGMVSAEIVIIIRFLWDKTIAESIINIVTFFAFIIAIKIVKSYLSLDTLYSCGLVLIFYLFKVLLKFRR